MDVAVLPSILYESFGVAAVETQASRIPVIIPNARELIETILPGVSNEVVKRKDDKAIAEALVRLYKDTELRKQMGIMGRKDVIEKYELNHSFNQIDTLSKFERERALVESICIEVMLMKKTEFIVGTVKSLSDKYGIRFILDAVTQIKKQNIIPIKLRIAGTGPQKEEYISISEVLGIEDITTWLGFISQEQAATEWANMDIAIIPSTLESESFGVSAVEAQACGTPVIISDIPGLMETTNPGKSSIVVKRNESHEIAEAILDLYNNKGLRRSMRKEAISFVRERYEIDCCFREIEKKLEMVAVGD